MIDLIPAWVDGRLQPVEKLEVHQRGLRHRAVSVFVLQGEAVLLQRRAPEKYHTPGLWSNACCTHPVWEEAGLDCAGRRLRQELGLTGLDLHPVGEIEYRAEVGKGLVEHELVEVFVARVASRPDLRPDPLEVDATGWMDLDALVADLAARPSRYTPWLHIYLADHADRIFEPVP